MNKYQLFIKHNLLLALISFFLSDLICELIRLINGGVYYDDRRAKETN